MHENNPNVADLSDVNRSSKVAERFSRLYDDLWTETCEELTQQYQAEYNGEKQAILDLAEILRVCLFRYANLHITVLLFNWQNNVYMWQMKLEIIRLLDWPIFAIFFPAK